jgi:regulator of RNase E activity RraA
LIHADRHGVLLVPNELADRLPAAADKIVQTEQELVRWVRSPDFTVDRLVEKWTVRH